MDVLVDHELRPTGPLSPYSDKSFQLDLATGLYIGYKEFTPGSIVIKPEAFMERRFRDVLPDRVADATDRAIHQAQRTGQTSKFHCHVFGQWVSCRVHAHDYIQLDATMRSA